KGGEIIFNAKTRRPSVCNALDCLVIHKTRLGELPSFAQKLAEAEVVIYADEPSFKVLQNNYPKELLHHATPESFGTEFLSLKMSVKTVNSFEEAVDQINMNTSKHSEAIIS